MSKQAKYYIYDTKRGFSLHRHLTGGLLRPGRSYIRYDARWSSLVLALLPRRDR